MKKTASSKTGLFLFELIVMIMLFSLSAAVCMRIFGMARSFTDYGRNLSNASLAAQSAAECFKSSGSLEKTAGIMGGEIKDGGVFVYYDEDWRESKEASVTGFYLELSDISGETDGNAVDITVYKQGGSGGIFSIKVKAVSYAN